MPKVPKKVPAQKGNSSSSTAITTSLATPTNIELVEEKATEIAEKVAEKVAEKAVNEKLPRFTEILGVFVALFTFVSVNIQIFNKIDSLAKALIFCFLIFLCLVGFLIVMHSVINIEKDNKFPNTPFSFLIIFILIVFGLIYLALNDIPLPYQKSGEITKIEGRLDYIEDRLETSNRYR